LNIIEYLFCERLFGQVLLIEKSEAGKVWQKKCEKKTRQKNRSKKSAAKKVKQKNHSRKITAEKVQQKKCIIKNRRSNMVGVYL
jgi:hypothetical protein